MAKKKKGGKKSGKKKSAKSAKSMGKLDGVFNELSKEFYIVQIRDLESKIKQSQEKCKALDLKNKDLENKLEQQAADKKDIVSFLKKQLEQRSDEIADLQEKIIGLQQSKELEKDKYELEITTVKTEMQEVKDQLTSENMVLGGKLASLEEFRVQKEDLLNKFAEMEELLKSQEEQHKEQVYQLERKAVVDKDRLKKEMILRVNTVAAEFRKVSNKQMAETTKRAIRENVMINTQLAKMSDKTMELISENDDMKVKTKTQKQHLNILEDNEKELVKKNTANQKVIRMLTSKAREQEEIIQEYQEKEIQFEKVESEFQQMVNQLRKMKEEQESLSVQKKELENHCCEVEQGKVAAEEDKEYLIGILADATSVLKQALQHKDPLEDPSKVEVKNMNLLYKVIDILNVTVEMGVGIHPEELAAKRKVFEKRKKHSGLPSSVTLKSPTPHAHYKLGDLGIVPPKKPKEKKLVSKLKVNKEKALFFTDEQLALGTPRQSRYHLVKSPTLKLPALSPV